MSGINNTYYNNHTKDPYNIAFKTDIYTVQRGGKLNISTYGSGIDFNNDLNIPNKNITIYKLFDNLP